MRNSKTQPVSRSGKVPATSKKVVAATVESRRNVIAKEKGKEKGKPSTSATRHKVATKPASPVRRRKPTAAESKGPARLDPLTYLSMLENVPVNVIFADNSFRIRYMNAASIRTLRRIEHLLPVPVDEILGASIDIFHKKPAHQRALLSNPDALPHTAIIPLGEERLELKLNAVNDERRRHLGSMVTWEVVTERLRLEADNLDIASQLKAVGMGQAVIEFDMNGTILNANQNFLRAVGYELNEIKGSHHSMFVEESYRQSATYKEFWAKLNRGEYHQGEFRRIGKGGSEIWLVAQYQPILDASGRPYKVVKFATNVTAQAKARAEVNRIVNVLASSSEELSTVSRQMGDNAQSTSSQAAVVSAASEQVSRGIEVVASSAEEMNASIREIANETTNAAKMATSAVSVAQSANSTVAKLSDSSVQIGNVIKVITAIAQQTNLLALNATIEAARAGESGKGFAVVANEVKDLAKATADATEEIERKIEAIQTDTNSAIAAITEIDQIISNIHNVSNTIASAVEEQTATTNEIVRNVSEVAKGSNEIVQSIVSVATTAQDTTQAAGEALRSAESLMGLATNLQEVAKQMQST